MTTPLERAAAIVLTRTMLGFVYFFAGAQRLAAGADAFGYATSAVEIALGGLLLLGLWSRPVLRCLAVLIVGVTIWYGIDGLRNPIGATAMNVMIVNLYILPRAALIIVNLFLPAEDDLCSIDAIRDGRLVPRRSGSDRFTRRLWCDQRAADTHGRASREHGQR